MTWALLTIGFFLRLFSVYYVSSTRRILVDMEFFNEISTLIQMDHWIPTHFFQSVGYGLLMSVLKEFFFDWATVLQILQVIASTLTLVFFYRTVLAEFGRKTALICLAIGAIHGPWIFFTNYALPETLFTFFLSICAFTGQKLVRKPSISSALFWGVAFTAAFWLKSTHVFMAPLFLLGLLIRKKKDALSTAIIIGAVFSLGVAAHAALSYKTIGKPYLSARAGGLNFIEGKCPAKKNIDSTGKWWQSPLYVHLGKNEEKIWKRPFTDSSYFFGQGLKCIMESPLVLVQSLEGVPYLFFGNVMWPFNKVIKSKETADQIRLIEVFFAIFCVGGLALYGRNLLSTSDLDHVLIWLMPIMALFLCVYIFKSEIRYRVPFDLWLIPLAVMGWTRNVPLSPPPRVDQSLS